MALGAIFGTLAGLGNTGEQLAEAKEYNADKTMKQLAFAQKTKAEDAEIEARRAEASQRLAEFQQRTKQQSQPVLVPGTIRVSNGKLIADYRHPETGAITQHELAGGPGETKTEEDVRGYEQAGGNRQDYLAALLKKEQGRTATGFHDVVPGADSPSGMWDVHYDAEGKELFRVPGPLRAGLLPRERDGYSVDAYGNVTSYHGTTAPVLPKGGGTPAPAIAPTTGGGSSSTPSSPTPSSPTPAGLPHARKVLGLDGTPAAPAAAPGAPAAASPQPGNGTLNAGTYRGLNTDGTIPMRPGMNPLVLQYANDILSGQDVTKIPTKARPAAEALARTYGWKGQGSLSPAKQITIAEAEQSVNRMLDPALLKEAFSTKNKFLTTIMPTDAPKGGGLDAWKYSKEKGGLSPGAIEYGDNLTNLQATIQGLRGVTGGGISEAQAQRYLNELPGPGTTVNIGEAQHKLRLLLSEIQVAKTYGYFPRYADSNAPANVPLSKFEASDAPAASTPQRVAPTPGNGAGLVRGAAPPGGL